jgi:menaquinone-dependent protoporphyrinogen oxidase
MMHNTNLISRRRFLVATGGVLVASTLICGGVTVLGNQMPTITYVHASCGKESNMSKVLVAYASKCGSTGEVAQAIGQELCAHGATVDVRRIEEVGDVTGYDAFVVGSAIRMGNWLPQAKDFVEANAARLHTAPTAFFTVHMLNLDDSEESKTARAAYVAPMHAILEPQAEAFFAGKLAMDKMSFLDRMISKMMKAKNEDKRDWNAIATWANQILPEAA